MSGIATRELELPVLGPDDSWKARKNERDCDGMPEDFALWPPTSWKARKNERDCDYYSVDYFFFGRQSWKARKNERDLVGSVSENEQGGIKEEILEGL